ncbi:MAG: 16S rRNA (adenine(1518)-N(6)/adenine(1519)-N(6))-dimethyltransferase RsmA [Thermodesulfovibrionales bacterium]|nr:16S rRNA (adenine(1518)-N(6)/adenine(1519)-N(6))-dimethyltransferase RsmA [Thermodesulfovibrionales bacterium]
MRPKKHLGQNFLYDPSILRRIVEAAGISSEDTIVEIGPGHGSLTALLAEQAKKVIAIELDRELCEKLKTKFAGFKNVALDCGNALRYPYECLPEFKVVSNIPYYITTPIIFRLFESRGNLISMTLTVQKEVAARIAAKPDTKDYGVLSIMIQYYAVPELKFIIPKGAFRPVPKVDSAVVHLKIRKSPPVEVENEKFFFRVVKTAFTQRRKTLANSLKVLSENIKDKIVMAGIDPQRRPGTLSIKEFARLSDVL